MEQIGRYRITGELGRGAMGIVFRALDPSIGREVAIKTIRLSEFTDPNEQARLRDRLFREARSAGLLSHPNIVTIYDVGEEGGLAYIAMELVEGPTLDHLLVTQPPGRDLIVTIIHQLAAGLDFAHSKGVIHRDIKPANVMVHEGRTPKITDFGVARLQSQQMTQAGALLGTPNYMSPEQIQGQEVDGRSDLFSLGVIAYEMLTGERPFEGDTLATVVFKIVHEMPVPPRRLNPSLGWPVEAVIEKALAKDADERYGTCAEFGQALENALRNTPEWKPLAPGAAEALPTVIENPAQPAEVAAAPAPPVLIPPMPDRVAQVEDDERPSALLRAARTLAILVLLAGGALFATWAILQWRDSRSEAGVGESKDTPPHAAEGQVKPTPMPPPPSPEQPPAEASKPEPPKPRTVAGEERPAEEPVAQPRELRVVTSPPGATVRLDTGESCTAPCSLPVSSGRHTMTANLDGYRRALRIVEPGSEGELFLNLERASGTLAVKSTPAGASISVNGAPRAERTPAVLHLPPGRYRLEVSREGAGVYAEEVEVKDAVITNVDVNFSR